MTEPTPAAPVALADRYPLVTAIHRLAGRDFSLQYVRDQDALLAGIRTEAEAASFPFGLLLWPAALGLAAHLAADPDSVRGKRVLEIGAGGVGLPGMAAAALGARAVVQTDYHEEALALLADSVSRNGFADAVQVRYGDWRAWEQAGEPFDVVIGSDVLYERTLHDALWTLLPRLVAPGGLLLLSDPMRPQAVSFVEWLERAGGSDWELPIDMTGRRVEGAGDTGAEIALFALCRKN